MHSQTAPRRCRQLFWRSFASLIVVLGANSCVGPCQRSSQPELPWTDEGARSPTARPTHEARTGIASGFLSNPLPPSAGREPSPSSSSAPLVLLSWTTSPEAQDVVERANLQLLACRRHVSGELLSVASSARPGIVIRTYVLRAGTDGGAPHIEVAANTPKAEPLDTCLAKALEQIEPLPIAEATLELRIGTLSGVASGAFAGRGNPPPVAEGDAH